MMSPEFRQLEELCGAPLSPAWLQMQQDYPAELTQALRVDEHDEISGRVSEVELLQCPASILEINLEARSGPVVTPENKAFDWPAELLVIGESGDGDYFCIDLRDEVHGVVQFVSQTSRFEQLTDTLDEYVEMLIMAFCEDAETEDELN